MTGEEPVSDGLLAFRTSKHPTDTEGTDMTYTRKTSTYTVLVTTDDPKTELDRMLDRSPVVVAGSHLYTGLAALSFRADGDEAAREAASAIADGQIHTLRTGYGIHQREVEL